MPQKNLKNIKKINLVSLGCAKNLVDSEQLLTRLRAEGYEIVSAYDQADVVIINTCGFINDAIDESLDTIGEALEKNNHVIVTGCLGTKRDLILKHYPHLLAVTGPQAFDAVLKAVNCFFKKDPALTALNHHKNERIKLTPKHYAYLKIAEGCDHLCSYCIIPQLRGKLVSKPIGQVLDEAKQLADYGVKELLVIAQDTGAYGANLNHRTDFWNGCPIKTDLYSLSNQLAKLDIWIRLHYLYPYPHINQIVELMAEQKILPYLDVPLQHVNRRLLKLMRRPGNNTNTLKQIENWRTICPGLTIRSTFIVGFPGETEQEFEELLNFLKTANLDRVGCFKYSPVEGAAANKLPQPISEELKQERFDRLMQLQATISEQKLKNKIGQTLPVIIDQITEEYAVGRSQGDAPEIDGLVYIQNAKNLKSGDIVDVTITNSDIYDLFGASIKKPL
ncbi:MAG: 30S ribosomal protein S12 methylthiotransferase RimO [Gammaproteobacteria bacterium]|nr:30S ribosomal protein S12 methylthiotransferase RimO [Gammaproteobacteria bacterium]